MQAKRVVGVAILLVIAFIIVLPPLASGSVKISLSSSSPVPVEHLYVTIGGIKAHSAHTLEPGGWSSVANTSAQVDLAVVNSSMTVALGFLSLGEYDAISVEVTDVTAVLNGTSRPVELASRWFTVSVSFLVGLGAQTTIMVKVVPELQETPDVMNLRLSFTAVPV